MKEYKQGNIHLLCGDCMDVMRDMMDGTVDVVLTDPPYGMGFQSNRPKSGPRHEKIQGDDEVDPRFIGECFRVLQNSGAMFLFCDWNTSHEWREHIENSGMKIVSRVIWNRLHHGMGDLRGGFAPMHDIIWYATKGRRIFTGKRPKSVLSHQRPSPSEDNGHPTCKPVALFTDLIEPVYNKDGVVFDPFMGSGSSAVASYRKGLGYIGVEINESHFNTAVERIKKETEQGNLF
jgi:DNA modification methylase